MVPPFMGDSLRSIHALTLDCQASGASPAYGDLLELGWAVCGEVGLVGAVHSSWIVPRTERSIGRAVRELTGWTPSCVDEAVDEASAWIALRDTAARLVEPATTRGVPTVIHYARFELPFLRDLHERLGDGGDFPFDVVCLHAVASRLFPDLPRRNIRALSGFLGHAPELMRRSAGHVEATAFIWQAVVPLLEGAGVSTWSALKAWLDEAPPKPSRARRVYPLAAERRRALPDRPGVYRFLRKNGDVLYVGKATSLKRRVASHFKSSGPTTERGLELLTQVSDIVHTETPSVLEAALLETDEIKRIDPPYNVQLRAHDRSVWFSSRDFRNAVSTSDDAHSLGPLPSERALWSLPTLIALAEGAEATPEHRARALGVPAAFAPEATLFAEGWSVFATKHLGRSEEDAARRRSSAPLARRSVLQASLALWLERRYTEAESTTEDAGPDVWDLARVLRRLERSLVQSALLLRRARFLCLLAGATVAFRESDRERARGLVIAKGEIVDRVELDAVVDVDRFPVRALGSVAERRNSFDAPTYDRLRVLSTELRRVLDEGGEVGLRLGKRSFTGERLTRLMRTV
jgi:DNA polymerase-3 subunit epsilon